MLRFTPLKYRLAIIISLAIAVFLFGWAIDSYHEAGRPETGASNLAKPSETDLYKSLNLGLAMQATYTNGPIKQFRDLGVKDKVKHVVVSFNVTHDSLTEYALLTEPQTPAPASGYPVLILCHGYVNPRSYSTAKAYLTDMEFYSQHGFAVIKPDFRGQGYSFRAGKPEGAFYSMAYNTDVMSLIAAIKQTSYLNKSRINIWGHSMGGYIALRAAVLSPDIKNVILLSAPVGSEHDLFSLYRATSDRDNPVALNIRNNELALHGNPIANPKYWDKSSPLNYLGTSKAYIQIHVGAHDAVVPPKFSADLDSALNRINRPHSLFIYPRGAHGLLTQRDLIWKRSLKLLQSANQQP